jgi:dethiobiotin synthetase
MSGFFVTGTDTGVGKTLVATALLHALKEKGLRVAAMKPVAAGLIDYGGQSINEDVLLLQCETNIDAPLEWVNPYALAEAIAPHIAAQRQGIVIDLDVIVTAYEKLAARADVVLVEGVGGFKVPLGKNIDTAHLAVALNLPVILVVGMRLGCLNHALLTAEAVAARGLPLAGWIANCIDPDMSALKENISTLDERLPAPRLGTIPFLGKDIIVIDVSRHLDVRLLK